MASNRTPLSAILPPLVFGTATFNYQYNDDPYAIDTTGLVARALALGIHAFDTSPYYGPSEILLGQALSSPEVSSKYARSSYFLLTKVGRIATSSFDYSPAWVRYSVRRSLERLNTSYLDVVYCHDAEFMSPAEVLGAIKELRKLRDEGVVRYVGICGWPIEVLASLAELIYRETGEPIDAVQSYGHYCLQNNTLGSERGIEKFIAADVDVVLNASVLGMGLLRRTGVPITSHGDWHPAPRELRTAVHKASQFCDARDERIEVVAIRWALDSWIRTGAPVGSQGDPASGIPRAPVQSNAEVAGGERLGVSVIGVSNIDELEKTMTVWRSVLDGLEGGEETSIKAGRWKHDREWSITRGKAVQLLRDGIVEVLGDWVDYEWASPEPGFVNKRGNKLGSTEDGEGETADGTAPKPTSDLTPHRHVEAESVPETIPEVMPEKKHAEETSAPVATPKAEPEEAVDVEQQQSEPILETALPEAIHETKPIHEATEISSSPQANVLSPTSSVPASDPTPDPTTVDNNTTGTTAPPVDPVEQEQKEEGSASTTPSIPLRKWAWEDKS